MYGLPQDTDLRFLRDKLLLQVCTGVNEVILRFDGDISILIQTDIAHRSGQVRTALYELPIPATPMLLRLLHSSIVRTEIKPPGTLVLEFSNGEAIEIYDTSPQYESYHITYDGKMIVV
jgi:hypothetical protein